jgi:hypothetical protein
MAAAMTSFLEQYEALDALLTEHDAARPSVLHAAARKAALRCLPCAAWA